MLAANGCNDPELIRRMTPEWACEIVLAPKDPKTGVPRFVGEVRQQATAQAKADRPITNQRDYAAHLIRTSALPEDVKAERLAALDDEIARLKREMYKRG